jgi:tRNA (guanine-N7-)-methyltransferase
LRNNPELIAESAPIPSTAYHEEMERRRTVLHTQLAEILAPPSTFVLEVGCGHGHFLSAYAQAHPEKLCIGIDIVGERVERALRKRDRAKLDNLFFVRAEARLFLETLPAEATFSDLFILFPDPWPKLRHRKHRILQPEFLSAAAQRTTEGSQLYFRTDSIAYFEYAQRALTQHPNWRLSKDEWPFEFCTVFQSRSASFDSLIARRTQTTTPTIS